MDERLGVCLGQAVVSRPAGQRWPCLSKWTHRPPHLLLNWGLAFQRLCGIPDLLDAWDHNSSFRSSCPCPFTHPKSGWAPRRINSNRCADQALAHVAWLGFLIGVSCEQRFWWTWGNSVYVQFWPCTARLSHASGHS